MDTKSFPHNQNIHRNVKREILYKGFVLNITLDVVHT